MVSANQQSC